jgi:hypothetical protein
MGVTILLLRDTTSFPEWPRGCLHRDEYAALAVVRNKRLETNRSSADALVTIEAGPEPSDIASLHTGT